MDGSRADHRVEKRGMGNGPPTMTCPPNQILVSIKSIPGKSGQSYFSWRTWTWNCAPAPEGVTISSGEFGPKPIQAWGRSDCGPNGYVIGVQGSYCGGGQLSYMAQPPGSDPYGTGAPAYNCGQYSCIQLQFMCGTMSVPQPSPMQVTVEYSS